jgi:hypothetical protein
MIVVAVFGSDKLNQFIHLMWLEAPRKLEIGQEMCGIV